MQLCVPLTDAFRLQKNLLLPLVGAVSFKAPCGESFPGKRHFLESSLNLADPDFRSKVQSSALCLALQSGKYEAFACDIGPNCPTKREYSKSGFPRAMPAGQPVPDDVYLARAVENVRWLRGHFDGYVHVENLNYFPTGGYERVCEPDFIRRVTEAAEVGLLLDLAHAIISAEHLGYVDTLAYVEGLPLDRVREIHLSRPGKLAGILEDLHEVPGEGETEIVGRLFARRSTIEFLTVEYYRDADLLCGAYRDLASAFSIREVVGGATESAPAGA